MIAIWAASAGTASRSASTRLSMSTVRCAARGRCLKQLVHRYRTQRFVDGVRGDLVLVAPVMAQLFIQPFGKRSPARDGQAENFRSDGQVRQIGNGVRQHVLDARTIDGAARVRNRASLVHLRALRQTTNGTNANRQSQPSW